MRAIIRNNKTTEVQDTDKPVIKDPNDVLIKIAISGLCRTDIFAAEGIIDTNGDRVLGHEFSGIVEQTGNNVSNVQKGDRVTVMPVIPCGTCELCSNGEDSSCPNTTMLGINYDGSFAEYIRVPASTVYKLPDNVSLKKGAYSEPLAASLSVLKSGIKSNQKGMIYGNNRFGQLILRILKINGFNDVTIYDQNNNIKPLDNSYNFAIETCATPEAMNEIFRMVKPCGRVVLKSRKHEGVSINFNTAIQKELTLKAVNYASFDETIELLSNPDFYIDDLLGDVYKLEDFERVFTDAKSNESLKTFFAPDIEFAENDNVWAG